MKIAKRLLCARLLAAAASLFIFGAARASAQSDYTAITVENGGTITGTVKWSGPTPKAPATDVADFPPFSRVDAATISDFFLLYPHRRVTRGFVPVQADAIPGFTLARVAPMSADERIRELALRWQELRDQGQPITPEELCSGCTTPPG